MVLISLVSRRHLVEEFLWAYWRCDVEVDEDIDAVVDAAIKAFDNVDILFNLAQSGPVPSILGGCSGGGRHLGIRSGCR